MTKIFFIMFLILIGCASKKAQVSSPLDPNNQFWKNNPQIVATVRVVDPLNRFSFDCPKAIAEADLKEKTLCAFEFSEQKADSFKTFESFAINSGYEYRTEYKEWVNHDGRGSSNGIEFRNGSTRALYEFSSYGCFSEEGNGLAQWASFIISDGHKSFSFDTKQMEGDCRGHSPMSDEELKLVVESFKFH